MICQLENGYFGYLLHLWLSTRYSKDTFVSLFEFQKMQNSLYLLALWDISRYFVLKFKQSISISNLSLYA